jgi:hypothetical protein
MKVADPAGLTMLPTLNSDTKPLKDGSIIVEVFPI